MGMKSSAQPPDPAAQSARVVRLRGRPSPRPSVTVVMPTYNSSRFVLQALESLFAQSRPPDEIVVVDDGSTDDTFDCLRPYLPRILFHRQAHRGSAAARNAALALSSGALIAFLDADDWYLPDHLSSLSQALGDHAELGLVVCGWHRVNEEGLPIVDVEPWRQTPRLDLKTWLVWKPVYPGAMMVRRAWLQSVGGFDEGLDLSSDVDLALRLALAGCRAAWVREISVCYRQHEGNLSRDSAGLAKALDRVHQGVFQRPNLPASIRRMEHQVRRGTAVWLAWRALRAGEMDMALGQLRVARSHSRGSASVLAPAWQSDFARFSRAAGEPLVPLSIAAPVFRAALAADDSLWGTVEAQLTASALVWLVVDENPGADLPRPDLARSENVARALVKFVQPGLAPTAQPVSPRMVHRWWEQVTHAGFVPASGHGEVTTLYLSALVQALFHRRWGDAFGALAHAGWSAWQPGGLGAWGRFVRAAARYLTSRT